MSNATSNGQGNAANAANPTGLSGLGDKILRQLQSDLGEVWTDRLSEAEKDLIRAVTEDAAAVVLLGLAGPADRAAREKAQVDAELLNLASAESGRVNQQFWASVGVAVRTALGFAVAFA